MIKNTEKLKEIDFKPALRPMLCTQLDQVMERLSRTVDLLKTDIQESKFDTEIDDMQNITKDPEDFFTRVLVMCTSMNALAYTFVEGVITLDKNKSKETTLTSEWIAAQQNEFDSMIEMLNKKK